jgi:hypothetical protein
MEAHPTSAARDDKTMQSLKRQLEEREKRITELRSQLDALKVIDQSVTKPKAFSPSQTITGE